MDELKRYFLEKGWQDVYIAACEYERLYKEMFKQPAEQWHDWFMKNANPAWERWHKLWKERGNQCLLKKNPQQVETL